MKKILSALAVLIMVLSFGASAFAESLEDSQLWAWDIAEYGGGRAGSYPELGAVLYEKNGRVSVLVKGLEYPTGLACDEYGNLYISETGNDRILKLTPDSKLEVYCDKLLEPTGLCFCNGTLYAAETGKNAVIKIENNSRTLVAGKSVYAAKDEYEGGFADGKASSALFDHPQGVAADAEGVIYVSDTNNMAIRKIENGMVSTVFANEGQSSDIVKPCAVHVNGSILSINDMFMEKTFTYSTAKIVFEDTPLDAWYISSLNKAVNAGIIHGTDNTHFEPEKLLSRAELCQILLNTDKEENPDFSDEGKAPSDADEDDWYFECLSWACGKELISLENGMAFPENKAAREELVTALYNYVKPSEEDIKADALSAFSDVTDLPENTAKAAAWAVSEGLLNGYPDKTLKLENKITRAEAAALVARFMEKFL